MSLPAPRGDGAEGTPEVVDNDLKDTEDAPEERAAVAECSSSAERGAGAEVKEEAGMEAGSPPTGAAPKAKAKAAPKGKAKAAPKGKAKAAPKGTAKAAPTCTANATPTTRASVTEEPKQRSIASFFGRSSGSACSGNSASSAPQDLGSAGSGNGANCDAESIGKDLEESLFGHAFWEWTDAQMGSQEETVEAQARQQRRKKKKAKKAKGRTQGLRVKPTPQTEEPLKEEVGEPEKQPEESERPSKRLKTGGLATSGVQPSAETIAAAPQLKHKKKGKKDKKHKKHRDRAHKSEHEKEEKKEKKEKKVAPHGHSTDDTEVVVGPPPLPVVLRCGRCRSELDVSRAQLVGKCAGSWRCNVCNTRGVQLSRLPEWKEFNASLAKFTPDQKKEFWEEAKDATNPNQLKKLVTHRMVNRHTETKKSSSGGGYYPLSWYRRQGYPWKKIARHCTDTKPSKMFGKVYRVVTDFLSEGTTDEKVKEEEVSVEQVEGKDNGASSSNATPPPGDGGTNNNTNNDNQNVARDEKKNRALATRVLGKLGAIMVPYQALVATKQRCHPCFCVGSFLHPVRKPCVVGHISRRCL